MSEGPNTFVMVQRIDALYERAQICERQIKWLQFVATVLSVTVAFCVHQLLQ